jgi:hypothetical protein
MHALPRHARATFRLIVPLVGTALFAATTLGAASAQPIPGVDSGSAGPAAPPPLVNLNAYCQDHGAVGRLSSGRTVYCTRVAKTDAWVWSFSPDLMPIDPNARSYSCDSSLCHFPDGSIAPNYVRCGTLCGEPPTSGDIQSGFYDCFQAGGTYEGCLAQRPR